MEEKFNQNEYVKQYVKDNYTRCKIAIRSEEFKSNKVRNPTGFRRWDE